MTCAGCKTLGDSPSAPAVQIPRDCEDLAKEVPYPPVTKGQSAKASVAKHRAALGQANGNLKATRECQTHQRQRFAGKRE
jgi:hypothetical protein